MPTSSVTILSHLRRVEHERARRLEVPGLAAKVAALKVYQQRRFAHTYADLLKSARYGPASRFFLDELYGPTDFTRRDAQFSRVVPALVRLFPSEIVDTVATLAELHALSEALDTAMAIDLRADTVDAVGYVGAWLATGRSADRNAQVSLTLDVAARLDRFTRSVLVRNSLRLMRGPARAAGLGELQSFLEAGFDTFRAMSGAEEFIDTVKAREHALASALFNAAPGRIEEDRSIPDALAQLP
jgi:hypothetical protein